MTKDDIRQLPRRALIDQALVCLTEIERRIGGVSDLTELIERLVQFGRQFDNIPLRQLQCDLRQAPHLWSWMRRISRASRRKRKRSTSLRTHFQSGSKQDTPLWAGGVSPR